MALRIDEWRRAKNITQDELAALCGVSRMTIRNWEENPGKVQVRYIPIICNALGVTKDEVIFLPNCANLISDTGSLEEV